MNSRIGYLVPQFPGQTHIFFWREYQALQELGIEVDFVSTRHPPQGVVSHSWSEEAEKQTEYLFPLGVRSYIESVVDILSAGPAAWLESIQVTLKTEDLSFLQKIRLLATILPAAKLAKLAKQKGWSHVHIGSCGDSANLAMFASILSNLTYSLSLLGPRLETYGPNQKNKWKYASFGLFQSQQLFDDAVRKLPDSLPSLNAVAPVGVNLDVMQRQTPYVPWSGNGPCRLYSCGRLNPVKGHEYVLEAVRMLRTRGIDARLRIGGEDEQGGSGYRKTIEQLIREKSLSPYVELLGAVSEDRNRSEYEEAHIYVMGSLDEAAGAVAAMEAMAMELPVVMTNVGATGELIEHRVDGILVQPQQPEETADAIEQLLRDQDLILNLSKSAREKIASKFNHRISAKTIAAFLNQDTSTIQLTLTNNNLSKSSVPC